MVARQTSIVRGLTSYELQTISDELNNSPRRAWIPHSPLNVKLTALQEGRSLYLHSVIPHTPTTVRSNTFGDRVYSSIFPRTVEIIKYIAGSNTVGRVYFHKLGPGQQILRHNDSGVVVQTRVKQRLQMYFEIPAAAELFIDNELKAVDQYRFKLVDFAMGLDHYYINHSNQPWIFLVFDVLCDDVSILNIEEDPFYLYTRHP